MWLLEKLQYTILLNAMTEKWRQNLDNSCSYGPLLTDWFKAFDCILCDFLIAKLEAYSSTYEELIICSKKPSFI